MCKLIVLLNHNLTMEQILDAYHTLNINSIVYPSEEIKNIWKNIIVGDTSLLPFLSPILSWIKNISKKEDYVLVQGDFGATYLVVRFCMLNCLIPIYSTTKRIVKEEILNSGEIKLNHIFLHKGFRIYGI